jgi:hypothetical protein
LRETGVTGKLAKASQGSITALRVSIDLCVKSVAGVAKA